MSKIVLDRMEVEEVGVNPVRLAAAIHDQLGPRPGAVPVEAIARALDITAIRFEPLSNIEGALVTMLERDTGQILVNATSPPRRRRFTIAHELGHFLNVWHVSTSPTGFGCSRDDLRASLRGRYDRERDRHLRQEAEANMFAIELLAPGHRLRPFLAGVPDLAKVLALSDEFDISREAGVRRYVECHRDTLAVVFSRGNCVVYYDAGNRFPRLALRKDSPLPDLPTSRAGVHLSDTEEAEPTEWLLGSGRYELTAQTLHQQDGWAMTLLSAEELDEDDGIDDTLERFSRFER